MEPTNICAMRLKQHGITRERVAEMLSSLVPKLMSRTREETKGPIPEATRAQVRALHLAGKSQREIELQTGVSRGSVWHLTR